MKIKALKNYRWHLKSMFALDKEYDVSDYDALRMIDAQLAIEVKEQDSVIKSNKKKKDNDNGEM